MKYAFLLPLLALPSSAAADAPAVQAPAPAHAPDPPGHPRMTLPSRGLPALAMPKVHRVRRAPGPPAAAPVPTAPVPDVRLALEAPTPQGPWTMRVTNHGEVPVRLAADARLLILEVTPRGEARPTRCELPADMRPGDDLDRGLVLPPGRSYAEPFEPRLYCFGERALQRLTAQAIVVARLGWASSTGGEGRQAVSPIDGVEPLVAPLPSIASPPIALPDELSAEPAPQTPSAGIAQGARLRISGAAAVDAETVTSAAVTVTLHNDGSRPVRVRFAPETLAFDLTSQSGTEHCPWPTPVGAATRELFDTLPAHGDASLQVMLGDYCGARGFERPGLLVVRPEIDTRHASGADLGLQTFDGEVIATTPTAVRLHRGSGKPSPPERPHLEPEP